MHKKIETNRMGEFALKVYEVLNGLNLGMFGYVAEALHFDEIDYEVCLSVLDEVRGMVHHFNDEGIEILLEIDHEVADLMVVGRTDFEDCVDLAFNNWESWLGFSIESDTLKMWGAEVVALYVLREMSLWGSSHEEVLTNIGHEMLAYMN